MVPVTVLFIMKKTTIPKPMLDEIFDQAKREYPNECCGMIMEKSESGALRLYPCENVQNEHHKMDPENFPRTAATAYFIDPSQLLKIQKENREKNEKVKIIYHSHINAGAYFSEEDARVAACEGEPAYPGVDYLVVSVRNREVDDHKYFKWEPKTKKFILTEEYQAL